MMGDAGVGARFLAASAISAAMLQAGCASIAGARLEARIDQATRDAHPRRGYVGPATRNPGLALYYARWKERIERLGNLHYPEEARGRIYGTLILRVTIDADGAIFDDEVEIVRSSGSPILDRASKDVVYLGVPYMRFSDALRRDYDVIEVFSTFSYIKGDSVDMTTDN